MFFQALPFRFYCLAALTVVAVVVISGKDFGPMRAAERRARAKRQASAEVASAVPGRARDAALPIATVIGVILLAVYGGAALLGETEGGSGFGPLDGFVVASDLMDGNYLFFAFAVAALLGSAVAVLLPVLSGRLTTGKAATAWIEGVKGIGPTLVILVLAWSLSAGCKAIGTASYLVTLFGETLQGGWIPLAVFLLAAAVAFCTGTSWGTMALLVPVAAPLGGEAGGVALMVAAMAAVLDGAILGDHVSPISDTTLLSSACSGCEPMAHVTTQAPYALLGALAAGGGGYALVHGLGAPLIVGYAVVGLVCVGGVLYWGASSD